MTETDIFEIESRIGYVFQDKRLLVQAFTHSSYAHQFNIDDNERMEFLGDAVLSQIVSEYIYNAYPEYSAGDLSKIRAAVVSAEALRPIVVAMNIMPFLQVAEGADKIKRVSKKIEANLYEAVLCAIFLDGGLLEAEKFILNSLTPTMRNAVSQSRRDYKTVLQEYCQREKRHIEYELFRREGPDNKPTFQYALRIDGEIVAVGKGSNKKAAEQNAAEIIVNKWRII